jgi:hypothetical protein
LSEDHTTLTRGELARWLLLGAVLLGGIVAFFTYGRTVEPLHSGVPTASEEPK